ncbi:hypothetical protein [Ornithinimicrobium sediminis]|uniref:hypothetical protein n=1 Tax=Ornithinimicrobium sediminis TaxID=2904603 RepID=UPI001E62268C|nr:hypothetical protein [Ornithinimicrobium sediminis]MCE0486499.1 hypothetical protein [Ornithinimicrobium sediminis]
MVDGLALVWNASVQLLFWVTLVFVVVERTRPETEREKPLVEWTPEHLPDIPPGQQVGRVESAFGLVFLSLLLFVPDHLAGVSFGTDFVQVLDAGMTPGWKAALVDVLLASLAVEMVKLVTGRWTWPLAVANAAVDLAFLGVVGVLWVGDDLLDPGLGESLGQITDAVGVTSGTGWWDTTVAVVLAVVVVVTLWDTAEGSVTLRHGHRDG